MAHLHRTRCAEEELIEIWAFIAQDDMAAADRLLDRIDEACRNLAENSHMGPARPDLRPGLRYFSVARYLVLYRAVRGGVEIVRVVHGARDLHTLLREV